MIIEEDLANMGREREHLSISLFSQNVNNGLAKGFLDRPDGRKKQSGVAYTAGADEKKRTGRAVTD
jgi:hypothetical protein